MITMLNANPSPFSLPAEAVLVQLFIGWFVPVFGALAPVIGGARRTIRQAITSYGIETSGKSGLFDGILEALPWLPRPLLLSLRNTFRRKSRLALTLATLVLGGAIFIAMMGVRESMYTEIDQSFSYFQSDVNVNLAKSYPIFEIERAFAGITGISAVESWNVVNANVVRPDGETTDQIAIYIPPAETKLIDAVMMEGRWLQNGEANAIVVSNHFIGSRPDVKVGDMIQLRWNETDTPFQVVGIFRMSGTFPAPFTYITPAGLSAISGDPEQANQVKIVTDQHTQARQEEVLAATQKRLLELGLEATLQTGMEIIAQQRSVINILISLLMGMGLLIAVVGRAGSDGHDEYECARTNSRDWRSALDWSRKRPDLPTRRSRRDVDRSDQLGRERFAGCTAHTAARQHAGPGADDNSIDLYFFGTRVTVLAGYRIGSVYPGKCAAGARRGAPDSTRCIGI
jgi:putative ABC transport system permease protein